MILTVINDVIRHAPVIIALVFLVDAGLFYAMPSHMGFDTTGVCPDYSLGCTQAITQIYPIYETTYSTFVVVPLFSVEIHEFMHAQGYLDEMVPGIVSSGLMLLFAIPIIMFYTGFILPETVRSQRDTNPRYPGRNNHPVQAQSGNNELHKHGPERGTIRSDRFPPILSLIFPALGGKANND